MIQKENHLKLLQSRNNKDNSVFEILRQKSYSPIATRASRLMAAGASV